MVFRDRSINRWSVWLHPIRGLRSTKQRGVFAVYEPHQSEEVISFVILGEKRAAVFDTGLGIGDIKKVVQSLTSLSVLVLNPHTHDDHVGDNW